MFRRFDVGGLLLLILAISVGVSLWLNFAPSYALRKELVFASFVAVLSTAAVALWADRFPPRPFLAGFVIFGLVFLLLGLGLGQAESLDERCIIGVGYAFITGVAARWLVPHRVTSHR